MPTRVVIIEDQTAVRDMITQIVAADPDFEVVAECGDGHSAYSMCVELKPDFVILDLMLPGLNGAEVLRRFSRHLKNTRVLVFSGHQNPSIVRELLQAGAHGFVEKTAHLSEFINGLNIVASGGTFFGPNVAELIRSVVANPGNVQRSKDALSEREREVLQMIAEGHSTKEIAQKLGLSVKTVDNHRTNMMRKLDLHNVASITRYAMQNGLIEVENMF